MLWLQPTVAEVEIIKTSLGNCPSPAGRDLTRDDTERLKKFPAMWIMARQAEVRVTVVVVVVVAVKTSSWC